MSVTWPWRHPAALLTALALTLANAFKPLVMDDAAYFQLARHIALDPLNPYSFRSFWRDIPEPAMQLLSPPVLAYWWAAGLSLLGDSPVLWKLWLFPFALALSSALLSLARRFASGIEAPLLCICVFSPTLLPQFNLMLDVPALALSTSALALLALACELDRRRWALLAGLVGGLALQTKYPSLFAVVSMGIYAALFRRLRLGVLALGASALVFTGWETFLIFRYGHSHFLLAMLHGQGTAAHHGFIDLNISLLTTLGGAAPVVGLLACLALRLHPALLVAGGLGISLIFALLPLLPSPAVAALMFDPRFTIRNIELFLYLPLGLFVVASGSWAMAVNLRASPEPANHRGVLLLLGWAALEILGIWWMTPFMAVRRVMPLVVCGTLLLGSLVAQSRGSDAGAPWREPRRRWALRGIATFGAVLSAVYLIADISDARARRRAVGQIGDAVEALGGDREKEDLWVAGHWAYQFYTERQGMRQLMAGRSKLKSGDWVAKAKFVARQRLPELSGLSRPLARFDAVSPWPWSTLPYAYAGPIPLRAQPDAQLRISIHRVLEGGKLAPLPPRPPPTSSERAR